AKNPAGLRRFTFPAPLSFFWKFLAPNDLPGGANSFYRGARGLSPGYWATGPLSPNGGATGSCRPVAGRQAPRRTPTLSSDVSGRVNFAKNTLSPGHWAIGPLSPSGRATGSLSPSGRATGVHFCKISKV